MRRFLILILTCILILSLATTMYTLLSIVLTVIIFYFMIEKFGKGIVLLETMAFYSCVIYLIMPLVGYAFYTRQNRMATLWGKVMPVDYNTYYSYVLPAITIYLLGLFLLNYATGRADEGEKLSNVIVRIKQRLSQSGKTGMWMILTGFFCYVIIYSIPGPLAAVGAFGYLLIFPGLLYLYFQPKFKGKKLMYVLVIAFFARDAINSGMFTVAIYMSIILASFFIVERKISFTLKISVLVVSVFTLFTLQLVKGTFRQKTWKREYVGSKAELFQDLFIGKAQGISDIFSEKAFFPIYARLNQGLVTAMVMKRIPAVQPYDDGASIAKTLAASVVPRLLWPDKPESGGVYNMQHFAGFKLKGWSTNIGPVGEAYGNFGATGGILYMFFFGLFIGWAYQKMFSLAKMNPLMILWIPILFFEVMYSMENDTLQAVNSLVKAAIFVWVLYKMFPSLFVIRKKYFSDKANNENSHHLGNNRSGWSVPG